MNKLIIPIHSFVDVITNSSTTIFIYQNGSLNAAKEVINEVLELTKEGKTADDLFYFCVFAENDDYADSDYFGDNYPDCDFENQVKVIEDLKISILKGETERPKWMLEVEEDSVYDKSLMILSKDSKYDILIKKLLKFLNSITAEASYD